MCPGSKRGEEEDWTEVERRTVRKGGEAGRDGSHELVAAKSPVEISRTIFSTWRKEEGGKSLGKRQEGQKRIRKGRENNGTKRRRTAC